MVHPWLIGLKVNFSFRKERTWGVHPKYHFALSHHSSVRGWVRQAVLMNLALGTETGCCNLKKRIWLLFVVCLLFCFVFLFFLPYMILGFLSFSRGPVMAFWSHWSKLNASCELVVLVRNMKTPSTQRPQEFCTLNFLVIAGAVCFTQRSARQGTYRDLKRSDHSSLWGLLVCWLCARWHFSLRRETETDSTAGPRMPRSWTSH